MRLSKICLLNYFLEFKVSNKIIWICNKVCEIILQDSDEIKFFFMTVFKIKNTVFLFIECFKIKKMLSGNFLENFQF